ncbi:MULTISPECIES: ABC transporter permease [unclassified Aminobacter]|jgi:peptide/nickel transport system permease protein|uniref:ABC transporter permease n=1 Tax=unclassified Aminobacter TaxID=2644704 RepID=UPI0004653FE0|nr:MULTISPECIES: ABC transporter permease [unclassified Aminobacter]TWG55210.1 peptide/nickel transport system permease protein [Aminobacter sp. J44]TWH28352.1 peptide/nickel transport system permease protein [Aminobacter sp. J15]
MSSTNNSTAAQKPRTRFQRIWDSDVFFSFRRSPVTIVAALVTFILILAALLAPWIAPYDPFNPASLNLMDGFTPPNSESMMGNYFVLGSDHQGRDVLSTILYGSRISLFVGFLATLFAMAMGISLGLLAGYRGGTTDAIIMRIADIQLSFPAILIALLIFGIARGIIPPSKQEGMAVWVLIVAIGLANWAQFARTVRGATMVERQKDYVSAAKLIGVHPLRILVRHVLPNVMAPVLVIATIGLALAIIEEATLSFLGVGVPPTQPSLGTLIRIGQQFLFSGEWWILFFPAITLVLLALAVNLLGDWLRDALNPRLR